MRSNFVWQEIWVGLRRNLTMTVALIVVVAISLSLLGTGLLFVKQVDSTRTYWQSKVEISVYLCYADSANPNCHGAVTQTQTTNLEQRLKAMPQVQNVAYVTQAQAWALYKKAFSNDTSYVSTLKETDMPPSLEIKLNNPSADYNIVASAVTGAQGVDSVIDGDEHPRQVLPAARRPAERRRHRGPDPGGRRRPAGGQHHPAVRV
jgi:cell division transport system permease protein